MYLKKKINTKCLIKLNIIAKIVNMKKKLKRIVVMIIMILKTVIVVRIKIKLTFFNKHT